MASPEADASPQRPSPAFESSFTPGQLTLKEEKPKPPPKPPPSPWASAQDRTNFSGVQAAAAITRTDVAEDAPVLQYLPGAAGGSSRLAARHAAEGTLRSHCFGENVCFAEKPYYGPHALSCYGERMLHGEGAEVILPQEQQEAAEPTEELQPPSTPSPHKKAQFPLGARSTATSLPVQMGPSSGEEISTSRKGGLYSPARKAALGGDSMRALLTSLP